MGMISFSFWHQVSAVQSSCFLFSNLWELAFNWHVYPLMSDDMIKYALKTVASVLPFHCHMSLHLYAMNPVDNGSTVACAMDKFSEHGHLKSSSPN